MAAYVIVEVETHDHKLMADYRSLTTPTVAEYGGVFIARGGETITLEGDWAPERIVVIEFPSMEQAKRWWTSEEYAQPKAMRQAAGTTRMIVVDGV
jgi:uncharacterized protein (DUF1330 family)